MKAKIAGYTVRLDAWFRRDDRDWVIWCPAIDVMTQARTKKAALESLREAVELWFESCIERGVLDRSLEEVGFRKVSPEEEPPEGVNLVSVVKKPHRKSQEPKEMSFSLGQSKGSTYIEGVIPAYIAARQLGNTARARG